ncbi:hypothetical protein GSU75_05909 [Pseudomonas savastanoi pv. phaseolicola]|nr:hypothetical protein [Pseudomonas savastanoi pv. phaseolicola]
MSHTLFRVGAAIFVFFMLLVGVFSIYWIWEHVLHLYGRLYRNAPVVETSYLAFALLMVPPTVFAHHSWRRYSNMDRKEI